MFLNNALAYITLSPVPSHISVEKTKRICGFTNSVEYDIILVVTK